MEKLLLDTFPGLTLSDRQISLFQDVYVERVIVEQDKNRVFIRLVSNHVIPYREILRLEDNIGRAFATTGYRVTVEDRFRLSDQYTPEIFWKEYRDSILLQLKEEDILQFNMFYHGESHVEEETLYLCCDDDSLFRARETEVIQKIQHIFKAKAGYDITMEIRYQEPDTQKETKDTRILYRSTPSGIREVSAGEAYHSFSPDSGQEGMTGPTGNYGANAAGPAAVETESWDGNIHGGTGGSSGNDIVSPAGNEPLSDSIKMQQTGNRDGQTAKQNVAAQAPGSSKSMTQKSSNSGVRNSQKSSGSHATADRQEKSAKWGKNTYQGKARKKGSYRAAVDEDCFYGRNCDGEVTKIADIQGEMEIVIEGMVTSTEEREIQDGRKIIFMFNVTDFTDSIQGKVFLAAEDAADFRSHVGKGKFIKIKGVVTYDTYSREDVMTSIRGMKPGQDTRVQREDHYDGPKRVELHAHTQMSEMDSVMPVEKYIQTAKKWGHPAIAITDHGVVQAFPDADHALNPDDDLKMIYGVEAYLVDDLIETVQNEKGQDFQETFVVFDLETTGIGARSNEIIEIGAVKVENRTIMRIQ